MFLDILDDLIKQYTVDLFNNLGLPNTVDLFNNLGLPIQVVIAVLFTIGCIYLIYRAYLIFEKYFTKILVPLVRKQFEMETKNLLDECRKLIDESKIENNSIHIDRLLKISKEISLMREKIFDKTARRDDFMQLAVKVQELEIEIAKIRDKIDRPQNHQ